MYKIIKKKELNPTVIMMEIEAPLIAKKAKAGQFIILRVRQEGERIPLTIFKTDETTGGVSIIFQIVGQTTALLNELSEGEYITDFVGPLGVETNLNNIKKAIVVGGGVGTAISYPIAKSLKDLGAEVTTICGFRTKDLVILENDFNEISDEFHLVTDDGSCGRKGLVTEVLKELLENDTYDEVFTIGPLPMMKYVSILTKEFNVKTSVSMNSIMIDGTGMCGCCRLTVDGVTKFACVDGPDFDGHKVDFDEAIKRNTQFKEFETKRKASCNLFKEA